MTEQGKGAVAAIQMVSGHDIDANLAEAGRLLAGAAQSGAGVAVLPENALPGAQGSRQNGYCT